MEWKDATSYSRGERGKVTPRSWQTLISGKRILIMSEHLYHPEMWVMNCEVVGIKEHRLCMSREPVERAQSLAISQVHAAALRKASQMTNIAIEIEPFLESTQ